jgi:hypothetical protein
MCLLGLDHENTVNLEEIEIANPSLIDSQGIGVDDRN